MAPAKSDVWRHFTKLSKTDAKCNFCRKLLKTSGNTSNLKSHLKCHKLKDEIVDTPGKSIKPSPSVAGAGLPTSSSLPILLQTHSAPQPTSSASTAASAATKEFVDTLSTQLASTTRTTASTFIQSSIHQSFGKMKTFSEGGSRHGNITQGLLDFICKDGMSLSVVDGEGFRRMMMEAVPLYKVPTRNTMKSMIKEKFCILSTNFKAIVENVEQVTITVDVWSNMMTTTSFLGVTIHFLDGTSIQSVVLGVSELMESHTGDYLGSQILSVLNQWFIPKEKVFCIVTDNEAAMVKAAVDSFGKNKHVRCLAHSINLVAESAMKKTVGLDLLIKKIRDIVKFIKRSVNASDQLREEQKMRGILEGEIVKMILDVQTRWNSTIDRFLVISNIVSSILVSRPDSPPMLTALELESAKEVKNLLSYLEHLTREISGETYATGSMAIPLLNCFLQSMTSSSPKLNIGINLKSSLLIEFGERFKDREQAHLLALSMFLDPRFKNIHFLQPASSARALNQIKKLLATVTENLQSSSDSESDVDVHRDSTDLWAHHKTLALKSAKKMASTHSTYSVDLDSEISLYLSTPVAANHKANPLEIWEDLKNVYPKIYLLARQYLSVLATSVPAERLFSKAGNTITEKRNRLSGELLSKLLFLNGLPSKYWK